MKLTKTKLKQIIKEELGKVLSEYGTARTSHDWIGVKDGQFIELRNNSPVEDLEVDTYIMDKLAGADVDPRTATDKNLLDKIKEEWSTGRIDSDFGKMNNDQVLKMLKNYLPHEYPEL